MTTLQGWWRFGAGVLLAFAATMPARAADEPPGDPMREADKVCTRCHDENDNKAILSIYQTRHGVKADGRTPGCQTCHGASDDHVRNPRGTSPRPPPQFVFDPRHGSPADDQNGQCLTCHSSGLRTLWPGSEHQTRNLTCSTCHEVHAPRDKTLVKFTQPETCYQCHQAIRAQTHRISRHPILEGKVVCSDCHNPHGSTTAQKLLAKNSVNETCWTCHAEKRGPFLWEHPSASDDCMNCHTPHGSTNPPLLRARAPWLCQECHGDGAPHPGNVYSASSLPGGAVANVNATGGVSGSTQLGVVNPTTGARVTQNNPPPQLAFRACLNCHSQVHGSNHPAGNRFLR
jgi:DmsE family decaheme c-type cytochrome